MTSARSSAYDESSQGRLFEVGPQTGYIVPIDVHAELPIEPELITAPTRSDVLTLEFDPDTISAAQAVYVVEALKYLGRASHKTGLIKATDAHSPIRRRFESRYDDVDAMNGKALILKDVFVTKARESFGNALGRNAVIDSGMSPEEVDEAIYREFDAFLQRYADPKNARARTNLTRRMRRRIEKDPSVAGFGPRGLKREYKRPADKERVIIDHGKTIRVMQFMNVYGNPIIDEITGAYRVRPTENGVDDYVKSKVDPTLFDQDKPERQEAHIAETLERATGIFYGVAIFRKVALEEASRTLALEENPHIENHLAPYIADAIADLGYCMRTNVDNMPKSKFLGIENHIERFGSRALDRPKTLVSADGILLIEAALGEQERRIKYWQPRYRAVIENRGTQVSKEEFDINAVESYDIEDLQPARQSA